MTARIAFVALPVVMLAACGGGSTRSESRTIVLEHSIGPVSLRESRRDVERAIGHGTTIHHDRHTGHEVRYPDGLDVFYAPGPKGQEGVFAVLTTSPRYRTRAGVGVGSSLADVKALRGIRCYGEGQCQHGADGPGRPGTAFALRNGKVWRVAMANDFD